MEKEQHFGDYIFEVDGKKLANVVQGLGSGDISECLTPDVRHAIDTLAHVVILNDLAPGFFGELMSVFIPHFSKQKRKLLSDEYAQRQADSAGLGVEWRRVIEAMDSPQKKDFISNMVALRM